MGSSIPDVSMFIKRLRYNQIVDRGKLLFTRTSRRCGFIIDLNRSIEFIEFFLQSEAQHLERYPALYSRHSAPSKTFFRFRVEGF